MPDVLAPNETVHDRLCYAWVAMVTTLAQFALDQGRNCLPQLNGLMWQAIGSIHAVPSDRDLRLAVLKGDEVHALVFPCRRSGDSWVDAKTGRIVDVHPTHWQEWSQGSKPSAK